MAQQTTPEPIRLVTYPTSGAYPAELTESRIVQNPDTLQPLLFLSLRNNSPKTITEIYADICCFDDAFVLLSTMETVSLTFAPAPPNEEIVCDIPVFLSSMLTQNCIVVVQRVVFADGTDWEKEQESTTDTHDEAINANDKPRPGKYTTQDVWEEQKNPRKPPLKWILVVAAVLVLLAGTACAARFSASALKDAEYLYHEQKYEEACAALSPLTYQPLLLGKISEAKWYLAMAEWNLGRLNESRQTLETINDMPNTVLVLQLMNSLLSAPVDAGAEHSVALKKDGTVLTAGDNTYGQRNTAMWNYIVAVSGGAHPTLGLTNTGYVLATGDHRNGQTDVTDWQNIVAIAAGAEHSVGVTNLGTVCAVGDNRYGQCNTGDWDGITAVAAGKNHTVGLKQDGTVCAVGENLSGCCNLSAWQDVTAISAGEDFTVGLKKDGTVLVAGNILHFGDLPKQKHIVSVVCGDTYALALNGDSLLSGFGDLQNHQTAFPDGEKFSAIGCGPYHSIAVRGDGTACAAGDNQNEKCAVTPWSDIGIPEFALNRSALSVYLQSPEKFVANR